MMGTHAQPSEADVYDDGHLRVEHENYYVSCGGEEVRLRRKEFLIVSLLARRAGSIVTAGETLKEGDTITEIRVFTFGGKKKKDAE